jgi:hypothetical protein
MLSYSWHSSLLLLGDTYTNYIWTEWPEGCPSAPLALWLVIASSWSDLSDDFSQESPTNYTSLDHNRCPNPAEADSSQLFQKEFWKTCQQTQHHSGMYPEVPTNKFNCVKLLLVVAASSCCQKANNRRIDVVPSSYSTHLPLLELYIWCSSYLESTGIPDVAVDLKSGPSTYPLRS